MSCHYLFSCVHHSRLQMLLNGSNNPRSCAACWVSPTWLLWPTWVSPPNGISISLVIFAGLMNVTNRQTNTGTTLLGLQQQVASSYCWDVALSTISWMKTTKQRSRNSLPGSLDHYHNQSHSASMELRAKISLHITNSGVGCQHRTFIIPIKILTWG